MLVADPVYSPTRILTEDYLKDFNIIPDYIKTGIFTMKSNKIDKNFFNSICSLQTLEKKLISLMNRTIIKKHNYLSIRERHLKNYLINYTSWVHLRI